MATFHHTLSMIYCILVLREVVSVGPNYRCEPLKISACKRYRKDTIVPNILGYDRQDYAAIEFSMFYMPLMAMGCSPHFSRFICDMYAPDCDSAQFQNGRLQPLKPCRSLCEAARAGCANVMATISRWPQKLDCSLLPNDVADPNAECSGSLLKRNTQAQASLQSRSHESGKASRRHNQNPPKSLLLRDSLPSKMKIKSRRYDVTDLGHPRLFQGWVDVQGLGAANDYCRVVGHGRNRFLSCVLAGTKGWSHQFTSKKRFDPGWRDTWFMRDMDNDGRDDYCRCVGNRKDSRMSCMKAGAAGFYGSDKQPGNENTFDLPNTTNCAYRKVNPFIGRSIN